MSGKKAIHPEASAQQRDFITRVGGDPLQPENAKKADQYIDQLLDDLNRRVRKKGHDLSDDTDPTVRLLRSLKSERPKRYKRPKSKATSRKGVKLSPKAAKREREWREWRER